MTKKIYVLLIVVILVLIVGLITKNIQYLSAAIPQYQSNLTEIKKNLSSQFNIGLEPIFSNYTKQFEFTAILSSLLSTLTGLFGGAFAVFLYLFFLLLEDATFSKKIRRMYPDDEKFNKVNLVIGNFVQPKLMGNSIKVNKLKNKI